MAAGAIPRWHSRSLATATDTEDFSTAPDAIEEQAPGALLRSDRRTQGSVEDARALGSRCLDGPSLPVAALGSIQLRRDVEPLDPERTDRWLLNGRGRARGRRDGQQASISTVACGAAAAPAGTPVGRGR